MNPEIGRFVTTDPWEGNISEPISLHKYLYANGNPIDNVDLSGYFSIQSSMTVVAITSTLASIVLPGLRNTYENMGYYNEFDLQFFSGGSVGHIVYGGFMNAEITAYSKNRRHARQGDFNVYMLGLGTGVGFTRFSDLIEFVTYRRTSLSDFEGFGRITSIEFAYPTPTFAITAITLPIGKTLGPELGISAGYGWKASAYVVLAYWDLKGAPRQVY